MSAASIALVGANPGLAALPHTPGGYGLTGDDGHFMLAFMGYTCVVGLLGIAAINLWSIGAL